MLLYFKQAWNLIRQEKLFSSIYIIGTGLSITVVMVLAIVYYIKIANIYPETNRSRLLSVKYAEVVKDDGGMNAYYLSLQTIETCFYPLQGAEAVSAVYEASNESFVQPEGSAEQIPVKIKYVDTGFWKVFNFSFRGGNPFTEADMQSGMQTAVIAETFARRIFGSVDVVGRTISLDFRPFKICGVVKDVSYATVNTYAQVWVPYTSIEDIELEETDTNGCLGAFTAYILASSEGDVEQVQAEAKENIRKFDSTLEGATFSIKGQPDKQWQSAIREWNTRDDFTKELLQYGVLILILLLVPAVSLSGMADSQMEKRLAEIGIRRSFGAPKYTLMNQLVAENLFFTLLGGLLGLILSFLIVYLAQNWILQIGMDSVMFEGMPPEGTHSIMKPSMMINFNIFFIALGICVVLNLLITVLPAWRASRKEIIYSLNAK
ncbi:putative ABC transport system permease protein [Parabacteroides sp. PF5-5]|uniref:ABC transporter permease n=1 Tax=unclassified Parabacteroides TaxID=2649774 RepID=UPI002474D800|nr:MULTISPECIES: ABC transporter permease [unclassified Parabacteroides]MDH6305276.1 putative ABC transport system permease protein [Parabacteroides sp. PH5-39]MDH6316629.1 putative ABC transport system permease protein [Parabacteroides sp. PF5-13]MDH6320191.1 putative ABC transport system permease protein [Parabacteroides sp. PH5-13]MDH6323866.1 putative ABC transport system permease protein [Parabacteroides sp. PH5-8]MDH6327868.1 putative ABC transport system permease protein [Parabacteroide